MSLLRRGASGALVVRVVVASLGTGLLLAGCSDDAGPSDSSQPSDTPTAETTGPTESEPDDAPSVQPATGPVLTPEDRGVSVHLPAGWKPDAPDTFVVYGVGPHGDGIVSLSSFPSLDPDVDLTRLAHVARTHSEFPPASIRRPVLLGGELVYHLASKGKPPRQEEYGLCLDGDLRYVRFYLEDIPADRRQALVRSVLATIEWGGSKPR